MLKNSKWKASVLSFVLLMSVSLPAHAAYPVMDSSNILQSAKNLAEQVKVVTETTKTALNTMNMVKNGILELTKLPQQFIDAQLSGLKGIQSAIQGTIKDATNPNKYAKEIFPELSNDQVLKDITQSFSKFKNGGSLFDIRIVVQQEQQKQDEKVLAAQKKTTETIKKLHEQNEKARDEINKLVEKAKSATGQNQLLGIQTLIEGYRATILANEATERNVKAQLENVQDGANMAKAKIEEEARIATSEAQKKEVDKFVNAEVKDNTQYNVSFGVPESENAPWK